jgi:hypothetical protein
LFSSFVNYSCGHGGGWESNQGVRRNYIVGTVILQAIECRVAINTLFETGMELLHALSVTAPLSESGTIQIFRLLTKHFAFVFVGWFAIKQLCSF